MNGKRRRELTAYMESVGAIHCVSMRVLSDALHACALVIVRRCLLGDVLEALSDLYTGHMTGEWGQDGREAVMGRVEALLSERGGLSDGN
jgi:hypothetical protein